MANFPRYAIYYASPLDSALNRFGADLLGYDAWTSANLPFPNDVLERVADWREVSEDPRKYGFHATLKAPMTLADGKSETELLAACADFARQAGPIPIIKPVVSSISSFIAVTPAETSEQLQQLAADCVRAFDGFRAPLTTEDRARRRPDMLTPRQRDHLDRWGYPYVMEEFRFHMTLTGRLDATRREPILKMLQERFSATRIERIVIDRIALFRQDDSASRFTIIADFDMLAG
jgi:putative phosphonate metabolism protein